MKNFISDFNKNESHPKEELIPVDGRGQIIDMLRVSDHAFREKILRQIAERDPKLAYELRREL